LPLNKLRHLLATLVVGLVAIISTAVAQDSLAPDAFPTNRESGQDLVRAQECLREKRYGEAAQYLQRILEAPEDYFFQPDRSQPAVQSLKAQAQRLLGQMPAEGRQSYELQYGAEAQKTLDRAARDGDVAGLAEVSRRFFHTKAGYEATELLGMVHLEHGQPLAAAMCFKRLKETPAAATRYEPSLSVMLALAWARAGMPEQAADTLVRLYEKARDTKIVVAGKERPLFDAQGATLFRMRPSEGTAEFEAKAVAWLAQAIGPLGHAAAQQPEQWTLYRGEPDRNALSAGGSPLLNRRWAVPTTGNPHLEKVVDQLRQTYLEHNIPLIPATNPLAVRDLVFTRTLAGLVAVDFKTGKRIWRGAIDESIRPILDQQGQDAATDTPDLPGWLDRRIWDNATFGMLSSDGQNVYCVEEIGHDGSRTVYGTNGRIRGGARESFLEPPANRLVAYSIETEGKPVWELNGKTVDEHSELAGAVFLGPPLPLDDRLYSLVEIKGEIRLLCLNSRKLAAAAKTGLTGAPEWSQQLFYLERGFGLDVQRQEAGLSPSYSDGVLVCPTAAGSVVAIDLMTRSLLWGYPFEPTNAADAFQRNRINAFQAGGANNSDDRWADSSVTIAGGKVFITPVESKYLHCLNLADGKLLWKKERSDELYIGCVDKDIVLLVGRNHLSALRAADGAPAWSAANVALTAGSVPSGRGFFDGSLYYLPLTSAEVAAIDVRTGKIVGRAKSRSGNIPGNLICYGGAVISQGVDQLESFYQIEGLRQRVDESLAKNSADPQSLALKGELLLDAGQLDEAVANLERSFKLAANPRTRQLLVDALLEGLKTDFAKYRSSMPELEKLADQPAQQLAYLRQVASGLQQVGEMVPAFDTYLKIISADSGGEELERVDQTLSVRRDRWVQARLKSLRESAKPDELARIEKILRERLQVAIDAKELDALRTFVDYFGGDPLADEAREAVLARLDPAAQLIEREHLLRRLEQSSDPPRVRSAVARMALLLKSAGRLEEGATYLARLAQWADIPCLDGKLGREVLAQIYTDADEKRSRVVDIWPVGHVEKEPIQRNQENKLQRYPIEVRGSKGPFFAHSTIEIDSVRNTLVGRGPTGRELWSLALNDHRNNDRNNLTAQPNLSHVRLVGHVALATLGAQMVAIDTLDQTDGRQARVLWRQDLSEGVFARTVPQFMPQQRMFLGGPRFNSFSQPVGVTGPASAEFACFLRQRNLVAVHPLTGKTLWIRHGIAPSSELFGDDELLFVVQPGASDAIALRTLDGQELRRMPLPNLDQRVAVFGRRLLMWSNQNARPTLSLRDAWTQKELWKKEFGPEAKYAVYEDEVVGVLEMNGHFTLLSLADGEVEVDGNVNPEQSLLDITILRSPTRNLLITNRPQQTGNGQIKVSQTPGLTQLVNGYVHGFDRRTGKLVFSTRVENRFLPYNQPTDLPVLAFAANLGRPGIGFNSSVPDDGLLLCIDKRNGRVLLEDRSPGPVQSVDMTGDTEQQQVTLRTSRTVVKLKFTDQPPEAEKKAAFPTRAGRAIVRGVQNWLDGWSAAIGPLEVVVEASR
jgi:outer membrane protein assembly factor BamB